MKEAELKKVCDTYFVEPKVKATEIAQILGTTLKHDTHWQRYGICTLIDGYTSDRETFHLTLEHKQKIGGEMYYQFGLYIGFNPPTYSFEDNTFICSDDTDVKCYEEIEASWCVPQKRVYSHSSNFEFCKLLKERDVDITFTTHIQKQELNDGDVRYVTKN